MRAYDWSQSPLGQPETWSQSLKTAVRIMLTSRQPMFVWWGEELINLYNDSYRSVLGGKHPAALGQPASLVWREIWNQVGPRAESAMLNDEGTYDEALLLIMERNGYPEETYYTFSYSPVPNDQGGTGGILCANTDDTQRILGERQLSLLRELAARTADARTFDEACRLSANCLEGNPYDIPFAVIYLVEPDQQRMVLSATCGIERSHVAVPEIVTLDDDSMWPLAELLETHQTCQISEPGRLFDPLPTGAWQRSPHQVVAVPIAPSGQNGKAGILVVGLNPFRLFDDNYQRFIDLVAAQISASIANAQAYEEERGRAEALAEINRAKTTFFSNVSHEFRTPLTLILGPLEDALLSFSEGDEGVEEEGGVRGDGGEQGAEEDRGGRKGPAAVASPSSLKEQLQLAHRNSLRLLKLVNTLLDFSRIEAGRVQAVYEPTDLATFTTELASSFRSTVEQAGMGLVVDCLPLPEPVYVDREMWEKIVLNLLSNAFKFTFEGEIRVSLGWEDKGDGGVRKGRGDKLMTSPPSPSSPPSSSPLPFPYVILEIQDTGIGIPAAEIPHLFKRFHRVPGARGRSYEGSGIGLSLVQELVKLHGGTIGVSSVVDQGTCFTVVIPTGAARVTSEDQTATRTLTSTATGAAPYVEEALRWLPEENRGGREDREDGEVVSSLSPSSSTSKAHILLVDDNADMRSYMERLLSQHYSIEAVSDGMAALATVRRQRPDLVLTDVMMPNLDGLGLLKELRADSTTQDIPIILLSARAGEESRVQGLAAGADEYLIKPFSARELLARVESTLKLAQMRQAAAQQEQELRLQAEAATVEAQNRAREAEEAQRTLHLLLEHVPEGITITGGQPNFPIIANSRYVQASLGRPDEALIGLSSGEHAQFYGLLLADGVTRPTLEQVPLYRATRYGETIANEEWVIQRLDGTRITIIVQAEPIRDAQGNIVGAITCWRDITERKQMEEALRESEERIRLSIQVGRLGTWRYNLKRELVELDQRMREIWGEPDEAVALPFSRVIERIFPNDQAVVTGALSAALDPKSSGTYEVEYRIVWPDGTTRWVSANGQVQFAGEGESRQPVEIIGTALDITERKQAEQEREQLLQREQAARAEAEAANRIKDEFLAVLSHELRTPLNPILGWAKLLRTSKLNDVKTSVALETIERNAKLQTQLIEDLLDVSRILQGKLSLNVAPVDLKPTIEAAIETVRLAAQAKSIQMQAHFQPNVESVSGDAGRLQQVVWNLLSNAVKFTPPGGRVQVTLEQIDAEVEMQVTDTGQGIRSEFLPHVFETFRQGDSTTTRTFGGLGLGLAICRHLIELHGGTIAAKSPGEDQGATFTVRLPVLRNQPTINQEPPSMDQEPDLAGVQVLVVEDNADSREFLVFVLEQSGATVRAATSAAEGFEVLQSFSPDVLVCDIGMPFEDGYAFLRRVRAQSPGQDRQIPAIALTAYAKEEDRQQALTTGFQEHFPKPVEPAKLVSIIASLGKSAPPT